MKNCNKLCILLEDRGEPTPNVILMTNVSLGPIFIEEEGTPIVPLFANLAGMEGLLKDNLLATAAKACGRSKNSAEYLKQFDEILENYTRIRMLELLGVHSIPIIQEPNGNIRGFSDKYNVVVLEKDPLEAVLS